MKKKPISMTLSTKSIQDAIKKLEQYRDSLQAKCDLLVSRLAQEGQTVAIKQISKHNTDDPDAEIREMLKAEEAWAAESRKSHLPKPKIV